jgi:protein TonB
MSSNLHQPNWLFRGLILLSVGVHLVLFMQINHLYRPRDISRIELTLKQITSSFKRRIPKPEPPIEPIPDSHEQIVAGAFKERIAPMAPLEYAMPAPVDPDSLPGKNPIPRIPVVEDTPVAEWQNESKSLPAEPASPGEDDDMALYYTLISGKVRGEALRRYERIARSRNVQGVVEIEFTIGRDGKMVSAGIVKSSGSRILDRTAVDAVKKVAPFAAPPSGPIVIQLPIKFKLL